jgi:GH25 family lysozyme M1 (1,4-beta-N-acetylmuramidase)
MPESDLRKEAEHLRKSRRATAALVSALALALALAAAFLARPRAAPTPVPPLSSGLSSSAPPASEEPPNGVPKEEAAASSALPPPSPSALADCADLVPAGPNSPKLDLPASARLRGVDASSLAPWKTLRDANFGFAFAGASHGLSKNASFAANWAMMKRCGLPRGAYHFLTDKSQGAVQARVFLEQLGEDPGELPPIVDVEKPTDCRGDCCERSCDEWIALTRDWITEVTRRGARRPILYTVEPFWNQCLCGSTRFSAHPLWLAGYPRFDFPEKLRFGGWSRWTFYQHAGNIRVGGGVVDLNLFQGALTDLERFIQSEQPRGEGRP